MLGATPLLPKPKQKDPAATRSTRFVPHWFMMLAVLVLLLTLIVGIVGALLR
jgi:type VI protein secretion system component VasF